MAADVESESPIFNRAGEASYQSVLFNDRDLCPMA
jgi:hypothetical protein